MKTCKVKLFKEFYVRDSSGQRTHFAFVRYAKFCASPSIGQVLYSEQDFPSSFKIKEAIATCNDNACTIVSVRDITDFGKIDLLSLFQKVVKLGWKCADLHTHNYIKEKYGADFLTDDGIDCNEKYVQEFKRVSYDHRTDTLTLREKTKKDREEKRKEIEKPPWASPIEAYPPSHCWRSFGW